MKYDIKSLENRIICADCFDVLNQLPDKSVDLVLTDPPYGIGASAMQVGSGNHKWRKCSNWDSHIPSSEFFAEIMRISKNQIVWGGNYFTSHLFPTKNWLFWDKLNPNLSFAEGELAWSSTGTGVRIYKHYSANENKIHPTQKPVPLFKWCLVNYSKPGDLILDPMCGSGTTALACYTLGRRYICIDKEYDYVDAANKRLDEYQLQQDMFSGENIELVEQCKLELL